MNRVEINIIDKRPPYNSTTKLPAKFFMKCDFFPELGAVGTINNPSVDVDVGVMLGSLKRL